MRRYFKRTIAVLAIALMCSTLIGGGVLAENESENDINNEVNVEEIGGNEDVPERRVLLFPKKLGQGFFQNDAVICHCLSS